ncbi:hypothetical protein [Pseudobutyrivibrio sp.]
MKKYSNELYHYRTKGSRNGYTKYSWYTPIGEKAKGPEYWSNKQNRKRVSPNIGPVKGENSYETMVNDYVNKQNDLATKINTFVKRQEVPSVPEPGHKQVVSKDDRRERKSQYFMDQLDQYLKNERKFSDDQEKVLMNPLNLLANFFVNKEFRKRLPSMIVGQIMANAKTLRYNLERMLTSKKKDPTTGFRLKSKNMSADEDMARVNPGYTNYSANTKQNCMLCTVTYEMRRRGYDVTANKAAAGYNNSYLHKWFNGSEIHNVPRENIESAHEYANKISKKILSEQENGARGNFMVVWSNGSAHSVVYEIENGEIIIRDCQVNKKCTLEELIASNKIRGVNYMRMDNIEIDPKYIKEVCS